MMLMQYTARLGLDSSARGPGRRAISSQLSAVKILIVIVIDQLSDVKLLGPFCQLRGVFGVFGFTVLVIF